MSESFEEKNKQNGRWRRDEHQKFLLGLQLYGKNWKKIEELMGSRSGAQIRSHAQKYFLKKSKNQDTSNVNQSKISQSLSQSLKFSKIQRSEKQSSESFHSYFFKQIIKFESYNIQQNFWGLFIDQKNQLLIDELNAAKKKSFIAFQEIQHINSVEQRNLKLQKI